MAINGQTVLAVIPARGGSKRCPRKNLRSFRGTPLLWLAWEAAWLSAYIDEQYVSTEDDGIKDFCAADGRYEMIERPAELATDDASNEDVLRHALALYPHDWVVLLQPTSPLRTADDIDACIERAQMGDGCISYRRDGSKNGAVYVAKAEWIAKHDFSHMGLLKYVMPDERSLDIDYPEQFDQ